MEGVVAAPDASALTAYSGRRVLITGHTGFKGAWLTTWLLELGADVTGLALGPTDPSAFADLALAPDVRHVVGDVRDAARVDGVVATSRPEIVFHLAAQALVRDAHADPTATFATNVVGTALVLDAVRRLSPDCAVVTVTTDKVYVPRADGGPYGEEDALGGDEPYGASKAAAEHVCAAFRAAYGLRIATARAGNVIGGGDQAKDRIVPDAIRALAAGRPIPVRNPGHRRPWQHVTEPLAGYLLVGLRLLAGDAVARPWNLGPAGAEVTVGELAELVVMCWGSGTWSHAPDPRGPRESAVLRLRIDRARRELGWAPRWDAARAVRETVRYYRARTSGAGAPELRSLVSAQIAAYVAAEPL